MLFRHRYQRIRRPHPDIHRSPLRLSSYTVLPRCAQQGAKSVKIQTLPLGRLGGILGELVPYALKEHTRRNRTGVETGGHGGLVKMDRQVKKGNAIPPGFLSK